MQLTDKYVRCLLAAAKMQKFKSRSWLLDALTYTKTVSKTITVNHQVRVGFTLELEESDHPDLHTADAVSINNEYRGIVYERSEQTGLIYLDVLAPMTKPCFDMVDVFELKKRDLVTTFGTCPLSKTEDTLTSVGRFIVNLLCMQYPFGYRMYGYFNKELSPNDLLKVVKDSVLEKTVTISEFEKFIDYAYFIGHLNEINTPSLTERALMTDPKVDEVKRKFIEAHKDQMNDPLVVEELERTLIAMDKAWIGNDHSKIFVNSLGSKGWNVQRKKQFLSIGGIPAFGNAGEMDFVEHSLSDGHTIESLPSIANEVRKGSYERGVETAKGGTETKFIMRAFQDAAIVEDDCGTKRTLTVDCRSGIPGPKDFIGRYIYHEGKDVIVTPENCKQLIEGKIIHLYSPMTCETKNGCFCYKCCGQKTKDLNAKLLGIQAIKITSAFMMISMKNMHGTALEVRKNKLEDILL